MEKDSQLIDPGWRRAVMKTAPENALFHPELFLQTAACSISLRGSLGASPKKPSPLEAEGEALGKKQFFMDQIGLEIT